MPVYPVFIIVAAFALRHTYTIDLSLVIGAMLLSSQRRLGHDVLRITALVLACFLLPRFEQWRYFYPFQLPSFLVDYGQVFERWMATRIACVAHHDLEAFLAAVLLGDKSGLSHELQSGFGILGIRHMLAVSGFHVGIWTTMASPLFGWFRRPGQQKVLLALLIFFLLIYTQSVGAGPSVVRAVGSFILARIAAARLHQCPPLQWPMLMVLGAYAMNPRIGASLGFQLSYAAVFGILFALRASPWGQFIQGYTLEKKPKAPAWLASVQISLAAWTATLPIVQYHFGGASLYFLLGNLLVVPLYLFFIWTGLVAVFVGFLLPEPLLGAWNMAFERMNDWILLNAELLRH